MRMPGQCAKMLARLRVVRRAAAEVPADRRPYHHRAREGVVRAVPQHRHLVAHLHHRGPDVVEELDLDDRLDAAHRHADRAPDDVRFRQRRVEDAGAAERALQAVGDLEDAPLAGDRLERRLAAGVGDVFAEDHDPRIARHLVFQRAVDGRDHRVGLPFGRRVGVERGRRGIDIGGEDVEPRGVAGGLLRLDGLVGRGVDFLFYLADELLQLRLARDLLLHEERREPGNRIALGLGRALVRRLVQLLVVRERVRVRADDLRVHERRPLARARVVHGRRHRLVAGEEVGAVDALDEEARERRDELRDVAAGRLHFHGNGDRVAVVLDQVDDRELERAGGVQRLPELPFARGAFADRNVGDLVGLVARLASFDRGDGLVQPSRFRRADRVQALRARGARLGDDVQALVAPVRGHLAAARVRVVLRADGAQQHLERRHAEREAQRAVAVVRMKPVVRRLQDHARGGEDRFVPGAADLEEDQALVLELDFLVVQLPRQHHGAVRGGDPAPKALRTTASGG